MDTAKVLVRRVELPPEPEIADDGKPTGKMLNHKVTGFPYIDPEHPDGHSMFVADETKDDFEMSPAQATAAVLSGGFAVREDSKSETQDHHDTEPLPPIGE